MSALSPYAMTPEMRAALRSRLLRLPEIIPFADDPELASLVASLGLQQEFGTLQDEMARFIFDADTGQPIPFAELSAELVHYGGAVGVRVGSPNHARLELRFRGIQALLNPRFSYAPDGTLYQLVFFPGSIARILADQGARAVLVRPWALNTVFGGFDPSLNYYRTNFWELENNDSLRFARLVERRQIPFLGTHDLVAHIAGVNAAAWSDLSRAASQVRDALEDYFGDLKKPSIASLVIPYAVGVLLDDLAQPPNYGAPGRHCVIEAALRSLDARALDPAESRVLLRFPPSYARAIRLARDPDPVLARRDARATIDDLIAEIRAHSVVVV